jgi:hypothetical protein
VAEQVDWLKQADLLVLGGLMAGMELPGIATRLAVSAERGREREVDSEALWAMSTVLVDAVASEWLLVVAVVAVEEKVVARVRGPAVVAVKAELGVTVEVEVVAIAVMERRA